MSFAVSTWPSTKIPIGLTSFVSYLIPPVICYIIAAVLAVTPQTRAFRVALWPVVTVLAIRAAVSVDMSLGSPERKFLNIDLVLSMLTIVIHTLSWTLAEKPLVRYLRPANTTSSTIMDALDLATNLRGHGWEWSRGLHIPRETRPANRIAFAFYVFLSAIAHGLICGAIHLAVQTFTIGVRSSFQGYTIFDETLPFSLRYFRSSIIATLTAFGIYSILQLSYDLSTLPAVLLLGQDPAQWPPAFDNPWYATSLNDFWGRRWHQWFRHIFVLCAHPFSVVFGRAGIVIGAFLSSAIQHHITMITLDSRSDMWRMIVPFVMMAPGILAERAFYRLTGRKVGGVVGWIWTMTWLVLWGNMMTDGFARAGMFASSTPMNSRSPARGWVENSVLDFDAWLHTL